MAFRASGTVPTYCSRSEEPVVGHHGVDSIRISVGTEAKPGGMSRLGRGLSVVPYPKEEEEQE